jgi:CheY-like chemotaxis protein
MISGLGTVAGSPLKLRLVGGVPTNGADAGASVTRTDSMLHRKVAFINKSCTQESIGDRQARDRDDALRRGRRDAMIEPDTLVKPPRVLIVDDEPYAAAAMAQVVGRAGFGVIGPFLSSRAAMDELDAETPDVALLDIHLGGEEWTSEGVAKRVQRCGVPILFVTGRDDGPLMLKESFDEAFLIAKPYDPEKLTTILFQMAKAARC